MKSYMAALGRELQVTQPEEVAEYVYQDLRARRYWMAPMTDAQKARVRQRIDSLLSRKDPAPPSL